MKRLILTLTYLIQNNCLDEQRFACNSYLYDLLLAYNLLSLLTLT